jgi:hypothetical protein
MSTDGVSEMLEEVIIAYYRLDQRDRDFVDMIDTVDEAGESITNRNFSRLQSLYTRIKGETRNE